MTVEPAVPVLESVRKLPAAAPHVKVTPALPERKSPFFSDAAVTAIWAEPCGPSKDPVNSSTAPLDRMTEPAKLPPAVAVVISFEETKRRF